MSVSVVIPTYNYGRFLPECIASVSAQSGVELDIVVVDDGSRDDTVEVCARLARAEPRLRVVRHDVNRGHIATFNRALEEARGDFVVKLDSDDLLAPGSLARSLDLLTRHPSVAFVYGRPQVFTGTPPTPEELRPLERPARWRVWSGEDWLTARLRRGHNPIKQPEVMIRRTALEEAGGHRAEVPASSDLHLWLRLAAIGDVGRINGPVQGLYRMHDTNMHDTMHGGVMADVRARWDAMDLFVTEGDPEARAGRRRLLRRTFAQDCTRLAEQLCDTGRAQAEEVEAVLAFAEDLGLTRRERWRHGIVRQRLALQQRGLGAVARSAPSRLVRDLGSRVRWQQWDRYGW